MPPNKRNCYPPYPDHYLNFKHSVSNPNRIFLCFEHFSSFFKYYFVGTNAPECFNFMTLDDSTRRAGQSTGEYRYDSYLKPSWYRFVTGIRMPTRSSSSSSSYCYSSGRCDTSYQGVLIGSHPSSYGRVQRKVCFGSSGNCCRYYKYIYVRNCGTFYVYQLQPTCSSCRYCTVY